KVVDDVLALQSEVARAVTEGIDVRLSSVSPPAAAKPASASAASQQSFDVFDIYLRGRYYWNTRTEEGLKRSLQYFQEAIDRSPGYALPYAGLADAYNVLALYGFAPRNDALRHASEAASKALALDDTVAEAHAALAFIHNQRFEWEAAEAGFKRAIALKPGYSV